ncbi:hypothetical protein IIA79_08550, partial [bacterium]|nr:hypothetical protein [bacterium]
MRLIELACVGAILLVALSGCGGGSGAAGLSQQIAVGGSSSDTVQRAAPVDPAAQSGVGFDFPSPGDLEKDTSFSEQDRLLSGASYMSDWPHNLVTSQSGTVIFSPNFDPTDPATDMDMLAYAIYAFSLENYDGESTLVFEWAETPGAGDCFVGLGNQERGAWDWFALPETSVLVVGSLASYLGSDGLLRTAMVAMGQTPCQLKWLRVGSNTPPLADLSADPLAGETPLLVTFDASGSVDRDGEIVQYDWDWDGDGILDEMTVTAAATHLYAEPGLFTPTVSALDNGGLRTAAQVEINVNVVGNSLPAAVLAASPTTGNLPLTVDFDATGSSDLDGTIVRYDWDWDGDGVYELYDGGATPRRTYTTAGAYGARVR